MPSLKSIIEEPSQREEVVADACRVLDAEVSDKSGLSGLAVKGAYKIVQGVRPGFIREVVDHLLEDFLDALDPLYQEALERGVAPSAHLRANESRVAEALLGITDARARGAARPLIRKTYDKLRPSAVTHVEAAVPRLGELLERHAPKAG
ncbi:MAG: hypothetical protein OZ948_01060 [Deltaproteobacteria bacterium]|nr:hypothetical protein [Deltaproteobacteria bacterium]